MCVWYIVLHAQGLQLHVLFCILLMGSQAGTELNFSQAILDPEIFSICGRFLTYLFFETGVKCVIAAVTNSGLCYVQKYGVIKNTYNCFNSFKFTKKFFDSEVIKTDKCM